jgi:hypothetical protein
MIEEKMIISFTAYLSYFDDEGEYINDTAKENAQSCINAINEAVNRFVAGVSIIAHHGFNLNGNNFHANVEVSTDGSDASLNITYNDCSEVLAMYCFDATTDLELTKSYNMVSIE